MNTILISNDEPKMKQCFIPDGDVIADMEFISELLNSGDQFVEESKLRSRSDWCMNVLGHIRFRARCADHGCEGLFRGRLVGMRQIVRMNFLNRCIDILRM